MSNPQCRPYFFTPQQSDADHPLFVFLPGMDETGKELMSQQTAGLEAAFDIRCFVISADTLDSWNELSPIVVHRKVSGGARSDWGARISRLTRLRGSPHLQNTRDISSNYASTRNV